MSPGAQSIIEEVEAIAAHTSEPAEPVALTYPQRRVLVDMPTKPPGVRRAAPPWVAMARKLVRMGLAERTAESEPERFWRTEAGSAAVRSRKLPK